ncbi:MAG TPA: formyltransferase family protein [Smithella sp.]|nr:formyltransferase family protein [Smithella sp.]
MKVLFMGQSSPLTMIPLKAVAKHHEIAGIAESTSVRYKPAVELIKRIVDGRKAYVSLRYFARKKAIPYYAQSDASQIGLANFVQSINPDIICVAGFSRLLKKDVFSVPLHGAINFHPALLPNYRGPQPLFWHYYFMEPQIGATIHYLDEGEDTGDIIKQKSMPIPPGMPVDLLAGKLITLGAALMVEALSDIEQGIVERIPQKHLPCPFRARHIKKNEQWVQWDWPLERVWHFLRGTASKNRELLSKIPGFSWKVAGYEKTFQPKAPGKIDRDFHQFYLTHKEGKIYIQPSWSLRAFLRDVYRFFSNAA